jgi:ribosomal protein S18 acetylase RimI-like enzyme
MSALPCLETDEELFEWIIQSDRAYFSAGATTVELLGGHFHTMPRFLGVTAAACAQLEDLTAPVHDPDGWISDLESAFSSTGHEYARVYVAEQSSLIARWLRQANYRATVEVAFAGCLKGGFQPPATTGFALRLISTDEDWELKRAIHERASSLPDGKSGDPSSWVAFERDKCGAGYMRPFLLTSSGEAVAAFSVALRSKGLRVKNLIVDPGFRRRGAAKAIIGYCCHLATAAGRDSIGLLAISGGVGERLYNSIGMRKVGRIVEFYRELSPSSD